MMQQAAFAVPDTALDGFVGEDDEVLAAYVDDNDYDLTFGLGAVASGCRQDGIQRSQGTDTPRGDITPRMPVYSAESKPRRVCKVVHEFEVVGVSNDVLHPLSYSAGVLMLLGSNVDLLKAFAPGGTGLAVPNCVSIAPVSNLAMLPAELRDAITDELDATDLWLIARHCAHRITSYSVITGKILRKQASLATVASTSLAI